jgi:hypothetical protein
MDNQFERAFVSDSESWDVFVGGLTPKEFCKGYASADAAISDYLLNYPFDEPAPSWLRGSLMEYIDRALLIDREEMNGIDWFQGTLDVCDPDLRDEYNFTNSKPNPYV